MKTSIILSTVAALLGGGMAAQANDSQQQNLRELARLRSAHGCSRSVHECPSPEAAPQLKMNVRETAPRDRRDDKATPTPPINPKR